MKKISKIIIRSFKSIEEEEIELGNVNVFIGANGSGKSNLLEALGVLAAAANGRVDDESLLRRGVRPAEPALYKCAFPTKRIQPHVFLEAQLAQASYGVALYNPINKPAPTWHYHTEQWISVTGEKIEGRSHRDARKSNPELGMAALKAAELESGNPNGEFLKILQEFAIYSPNTPVLRGIAPDMQQRAPVGLNGGRLPEAVDEVLGMCVGNMAIRNLYDSAISLIDWAKHVDTTSPAKVPLTRAVPAQKKVIRFVDRYMQKSRNTLTAYDASEGALYILFHVVLAALPTSPRFFAIDNADHALNPRLCRELFRLISEWYVESPIPRQILLTTHNPLVLDGLPLLNDEVRLFTVARSRTGRTLVRRVEVDSRLHSMINDGWTLSRLWVMGHLGGVANV
jgi:energy-coupling factor transporter ATP-binding protein EcfA2